MSTVIIKCLYCTNDFEKSKAAVTYRSKQQETPRFFCTRSCRSKYFQFIDPRKPTFVPYGTKYRQKYDPKFSWYVQRVSNDRRFKSMPHELRQPFLEHIAEIWTGRCNLTGVELELRDYKGKTNTENRFLIASLDRIDCSLPYQPGNVQWTSMALNEARCDQDLNLFKEGLIAFLKQIP